MAPEHTFAAKCRLAPVTYPAKEDGMPPIDAQFFYSSVIPIDDPLSTGSVVGSAADARSSKSQLRPFSRGDNNALEKAWLGLSSEDDRLNHLDAIHGRLQTLEANPAIATRRSLLVQAIAGRHFEKHRSGYQPQDVAFPEPSDLPSTPAPACCSQLQQDVCDELQQTFCAVARDTNPYLGAESVARDVIAALNELRRASSSAAEPSPPANDAKPSARHRGNSLSGMASSLPSQGVRIRESAKETNGRPRSVSQMTHHNSRLQSPIGSSPLARPPLADDGISGQPFVRVDSIDTTPSSSSPVSRRDTLASQQEDRRPQDGQHASAPHSPVQDVATTIRIPKEVEYRKSSADVAVGVSRLHMVSLPLLQMKPIYWSPVNDVAVVMRATWFYRDTMLPVPPDVANRLEAGYHELRPWSETWADEIKCAVDVGSAGEEKISYRLWPKEDQPQPLKTAMSAFPAATEPFCAARCFRGEIAATGSIELPSGTKTASESTSRPFSNYHVIYKNEVQAFLLKPSLKPSAYYGRKPVAKITKGITVGIPVVRGFDRRAWEKIHESKQTPNKPGVSAATESHDSSGRGVCPACKADKDRGQATDLIFVAHGIGQKFAERVESFHFTHAINDFRRAVNSESSSPIVQQVLRKGYKGLMILPLNWRLGLSFEDGGPLREEDKEEYAPDGFGLKDIEPNSIPAVRSIISDVMFDIPFYMSHHKGKMIRALVSEANRVYRLWCRNNPGFAENGRVHLIGHSLGSAMALEILSRQPSTVPRLDLSRTEPETRFFEFDTKNLFLAGSPAGFFLLLERGVLLPRRGRVKPGADPNDTTAPDIVGEAGKFGCIAVDNIYNILAKEDPIAYLLNGAIDPVYSSNLKTAYLPSTATSLLQSVGSAMRSIVPGMPAATPNPLLPEPERPAVLRLPSQLELEVHDFTREEVAEKKAYLLNDNGQIDWYLRSGGGPLELQYLNMLGAHTSYWTNQDFIRMLCMEIGRKPGRANTIPAMRAIKATKRLLPAASG
ncbi:DDHD domain-containing protein [Stachybotrys elegans]|uniref:DDHD domain-containing protein n=1 Tax=Stachybotrys elegans TaxID=80388 RepID=A0A8K0SLY0_9HYPO|nr:DDHD domain-containing protein [Stachybotrys elegans]